MFYLLVLDPQMTPIKIVICVLCLALLISESAFSICLGCKIYNLFNKESAKHCPGGVCEVVKKDKIQTFNLTQKLITIIVTALIIFGLYSFSKNVENRSAAMSMMKMMSSMSMDNDKCYMDMDMTSCGGKCNSEDE
jgi:hypothetical protein